MFNKLAWKSCLLFEVVSLLAVEVNNVHILAVTNVEDCKSIGSRQDSSKC